MKSLTWFRLYAEAVDDEKLRLLAFEDRWHFVALLCCKARGILDEPDTGLLLRKVAVKLGLDLRELGEVIRRLAEVGLICKETLQPLAWDHRQFQSDSSSERVRLYRERMKRNGNVSETAQETETETDTETEKEKEKTARKRASAVDKPADVSQETWEAWKSVRKGKRAALTPIAVAGVRREAAKAGMTMEDALTVCCERGWAGFNAEWMGAAKGADVDAVMRQLEAEGRA